VRPLQGPLPASRPGTPLPGDAFLGPPHPTQDLIVGGRPAWGGPRVVHQFRDHPQHLSGGLAAKHAVGEVGGAPGLGLQGSNDGTGSRTVVEQIGHLFGDHLRVPSLAQLGVVPVELFDQVAG